MVRIRLTRVGRKNLAHYRVVITNAREKRDSYAIEQIGNFSPHKKEWTLDMDRVNYWLSVGAQPSDRVRNYLIKTGVIKVKKSEKKVFTNKPGKKSLERAKKLEESKAS